jgi:hypothetical protein
MILKYVLPAITALLLVITAAATAQEKIVVDSVTYITCFKYKGEDSGYIVRDSTIIGYLSKKASNKYRDDMLADPYLGNFVRFMNTYYRVYDRENKQTAIILLSRADKAHWNVQIVSGRWAEVWRMYDVADARKLQMPVKLLLAEDRLW